MRKSLIAIFAAILVAGPAAAAGYLKAEQQPGFVVGYSASNGQAAITEEVPSGETVDKWTRMITSQFFRGFARASSPYAFLEGMQKSLASGCPGFKVSAITTEPLAGQPAARMRADCPLNPKTGLPETFWIIAIANQNDMHIRQVAFRKVPDAADTAWAERVLLAARWCGDTAATGGC